MKSLIKNNLTGKKVLIFFGISTSIYLVMLFITIPYLTGLSGGMKILDMMPTGYDEVYVNSLMTALGEAGRHAYLVYQLPLDFIYPFFFAVSNCLIIAWFLNKLGKLDTRLLMICWLPLFAGFFDYSENIGIVAILKSYPDISSVLVKTVNLFSVLKSVTVSISLTILLAIICIWYLLRKLIISKK